MEMKRKVDQIENSGRGRQKSKRNLGEICFHGRRTPANVWLNQAAMTGGGGGDDDEELGELEEEERVRESQALAAKAELEEKLEAVRPGDYQLQVFSGTRDVKF